MSTIRAIKDFLVHANAKNQDDVGRVIFEEDQILVQRRHPSGEMKIHVVTWLEFESNHNNALIVAWDRLGGKVR